MQMMYLISTYLYVEKMRYKIVTCMSNHISQPYQFLTSLRFLDSLRAFPKMKRTMRKRLLLWKSV